MDRIVLGVLWLGIILYGIFLAPGIPFSEDPVAQQLIRGQFEGVDSGIVTMFSLLGLYPIAFVVLFWPKDDRKLPAWPFTIGAFGLGAFILTPYILIRDWSSKKVDRRIVTIGMKLQHRIFLISLGVFSFTVMAYGIGTGSIAAYEEAFWNSHFLHVMTIDFVLFTYLAFVSARHLYPESENKHWLTLIPIVGIYLFLFVTDHKERIN